MPSWWKNLFSGEPAAEVLTADPNSHADRVQTAVQAKDLSADHAVSSEDKDLFQRYPFARRVAQTIIHRQAEDCIVFGIYGAWGEGKTSVINFIQTELAKNDHMMTLTFNPWRYSGEEDLLRQFFEKIAATLKKGLHTKKEIIGKLMGKYGKFLKIDIPMVGNIGEKVEGIGDVLGETEVEELKRRVGGIIKENGKKLVIFIDDIDRLEKTEIHSIFRLVKLTADFPNVVYVLSFDDQMVSAAIGERFGEGDKNSGRQFLEKIIQVPLRIPPATGEALEDFCLKQIKAAIAASHIDLKDADQQRLSRLLSITLLPSISTPRLAVRYANSLSFALPLLRGEVDMVDLIFLEGIKNLYPSYYAVITENVDLFMGGMEHPFDDSDDQKRNSLIAIMDPIGQQLTRTERRGIDALIKELFPRVKRLLENDFSKPPPDVQGDKRLHDPVYFSRYFTYTVRSGDLSDGMFEALLQSLKQPEVEPVAEAMKQLINQSSARQFASALRRKTGDLEVDGLKRLATICTKYATWFPTKGIDVFINAEKDPLVQSAIFVADTVTKVVGLEQRRTFAAGLISQAETLEFAVQLHGQLSTDETMQKKIFSQEDYAQFTASLVQKAVDNAGDQPFWEPAMADAGLIIHAWHDAAPEQLRHYVQAQVAARPSSILTFVEAILPTRYSTLLPQSSYKGNLTMGAMQVMESAIGKDQLLQYIRATYSADELDQRHKPLNNDTEGPYQTPLNIARQVIESYNMLINVDGKLKRILGGE